jgi:rifampicin phosphotransferase
VLVGHGASTRRATGRVRLVNSIEDFDTFEPGEVLVARATAPAWTPLFARAAAVVTDAGTLVATRRLLRANSASLRSLAPGTQPVA